MSKQKKRKLSWITNREGGPCTTTDIAKTLGLSVETVRCDLRNAIRKMKIKAERDGLDIDEVLKIDKKHTLIYNNNIYRKAVHERKW